MKVGREKEREGEDEEEERKRKQGRGIRKEMGMKRRMDSTVEKGERDVRTWWKERVRWGTK